MQESALRIFIRNQIHVLGLLLTKNITVSQILNKPWAIVDGDFEIQKLIFEKEGKLILSKNGIVQEGGWHYYPEANSFLVDRISDKILCNLLFLDDKAIILKLDGTKNEYFAFANENTLPSLNLLEYLTQKILQKYDIRKFVLINGHILNVYFDAGTHTGTEYFYYENAPVTSDNNETTTNGFHLSSDYKYLFIVQDGRIKSRLSCIKETLENNEQVYVFGNQYVYKADGTPASGNLSLKDTITYIHCEDGVLFGWCHRYKLKGNIYIILQQKRKESISIGDEMIKSHGIMNTDLEFRVRRQGIVIIHNKVVKVHDYDIIVILLIIIFIVVFLCTIALILNY